MTGKEALKYISNGHITTHSENSIWSMPIKETIEYRVIDEELDELTKYKRAFEILKKHNLDIGKNANTETGYYIHCESELLTDEHELLEELMHNENS